jgi:hypothetical protein
VLHYGAPERYFSTHSGLLTPPKSTLRVLLVPLFGQSQSMRPVKCVKASCSPTPHCFLTCHQLWLLGYDLLLPQLRQ